MVGQESPIQAHAGVADHQGLHAVHTVGVVGVLMAVTGDPTLGIAVVELRQSHIGQILGLERLHLHGFLLRGVFRALAEGQCIGARLQAQLVAAVGVGGLADDAALFIGDDNAGNQHIAAAVRHLTADNTGGTGRSIIFGQLPGLLPP